jgi:hypothetical protein
VVLIGKWVDLNPKMGSSKIELWRKNVQFPNTEVTTHNVMKCTIEICFENQNLFSEWWKFQTFSRGDIFHRLS